ncbi:MAG: protein kinase, partial [Thermoguttaceae bacterium]|nr:protein kinase [Thermoguttaceae bacterium]
MTTHPEDNILILFTNGRLQEEEEDALELHLSVCGECRARLERIEHLGMETPFLEEIKTAANLRLPDELYEGCILRNQFHLEKKLGSGGIGVIWKALEEHVHRHVVLKFVKMNTGRVAQSTNNLREMFHKVQMLQHSNICPLYDMFDDEQHGLYLVMKYIEGETLEDYRKRKGTLSLEEAVKILWPVALGLDYAHSRRVIHRDIKPQNILISASEDGVQIIDFDLADTFRDSLAS